MGHPCKVADWIIALRGNSLPQIIILNLLFLSFPPFQYLRESFEIFLLFTAIILHSLGLINSTLEVSQNLCSLVFCCLNMLSTFNSPLPAASIPHKGSLPYQPIVQSLSCLWTCSYVSSCSPGRISIPFSICSIPGHPGLLTISRLC